MQNETKDGRICESPGKSCFLCNLILKIIIIGCYGLAGMTLMCYLVTDG